MILLRYLPRNQVAAAIRWIDGVAPEGWCDRVDVDRLNMLNPQRCVLGQALREGGRTYSAGYGRGLLLLEGEAPTRREQMRRLGFTSWVFIGYDRTWRRQLRRRR